MNIILFTNVHGRPGSLNLSLPRIYIPLMSAALILLASLVYLGFSWGQATSRVEPSSIMAGWKADVDDQKQVIEQTRNETEAHLDALAMRLGQLQARILRLEGVGERLVDMGKLDKAEFDFTEPPPQGGPADLLQDADSELPDLLSGLDRLSSELEQREQQLVAMESILFNKELHKEGMPAGRPVQGGWMSSAFGKRTDPFTGKQAYHEGVDFAGKKGSPVVAVAGGVVTWAGKRYGYGNLVEINHGNGYVTRYGHCQATLVSVGDTVKQGQEVALMGSTGRSTGPHVHFEVLKNGKPVNPERYVWAKR